MAEDVLALGTNPYREPEVQSSLVLIARKDAKIKALEMENELMRNFLSLTERK